MNQMKLFISLVIYGCFIFLLKNTHAQNFQDNLILSASKQSLSFSDEYQVDSIAFKSVYFNGETPNDWFGYSLANAGDVNNDSYDDILIGALRYNSGSELVGRAYCYFGDIVIGNNSDIIFTGKSDIAHHGVSVASAGDVDGDGCDEIIVGANYIGEAYIYFGSDSIDSQEDLVFSGFDENYGCCVSSAGDVNGDGYADVIIGASYSDVGDYRDAGHAYLYFGGDDMDSNADIILSGDSESDWFGSAVACAGDVNGDGFSDVIVGAPNAAEWNTGTAYVYFGGVEMDSIADVVMIHGSPHYEFGHSVAGAGDVNGDGFDDVVIGAWTTDPIEVRVGTASIYFGGMTMDDVRDVYLHGENATDEFGKCVAAAGDINNDGYGDIIIGAPYNNDGGANTGKAYLYLGGDPMNEIADISIFGEARDERFCSAVSSAGDVNKDCYSDFLIGAFENNANGTDAGRAYLFLSFSQRIVPQIMSIKDFPGDQGGKVILTWKGSDYDSEKIAKISDYIIQYSYGAENENFNWETVDTILAIQNSIYTAIVETKGDSSEDTNGTHYFIVSAQTTNPLLYWESTPVPGYSVDNLAPSPPGSLNIKSLPDSTIQLCWNKNIIDPDVKDYIIFRSLIDGFDIYPEFQIGATSDTFYVDEHPILDQINYYRIVAVDIHGNNSLPSHQASAIVTDLQNYDETKPADFFLYQNYPNPFNPITTIRFNVKKPCRVSLGVYTIVGRLVAKLEDKYYQAGQYQIKFDAQGFPSGIYFYRIKMSDFTHIKKMVLLE